MSQAPVHLGHLPKTRIMRDEKHRLLSIKAYQAYEHRTIAIETFKLANFGPKELLPLRDDPTLAYVLRLGTNAEKNKSLAAIPNRLDDLGILYVGGHESGRNTHRYNTLLKSCRQAEEHYSQHGYAKNDQRHAHQVATKITTGVLAAGFRVSDCCIDLLCGGNEYNELEFLIGYQERYHHLPPWNSTRGGASAYVANQSSHGLAR